MTSVSFQGERGAYSQAAALSFFDETIETVALPTFADVISSTENTKTEYCILPVENSLEGSIGESYDLLEIIFNIIISFINATFFFLKFLV